MMYYIRRYDSMMLWKESFCTMSTFTILIRVVYFDDKCVQSRYKQWFNMCGIVYCVFVCFSKLSSFCWCRFSRH